MEFFGKVMESIQNYEEQEICTRQDQEIAKIGKKDQKHTR